VNESDALIFHFHKRNFNVSDMPPPHRKPQQRYVFFAFESLAHDLEFPFPVAQFSNRTAHFFNWTMTHRRDSDVHNPMIDGTLRRKKTSPIGDQLPPKLSKGVRPEAPSELMDPFATAKERYPDYWAHDNWARTTGLRLLGPWTIGPVTIGPETTGPMDNWARGQLGP